MKPRILLLTISLALSSLASGGADAGKIVGEWQSVSKSPREPIGTTFVFRADGTYESVMTSANGAFAPIRQKGSYTIAGETISFNEAGAMKTTVPYAFDGPMLVFPESPGMRFKKKD